MNILRKSVTVLFYTQHNQYLFVQKDKSYATIREEIDEGECDSFILAASRALITTIGKDFIPNHLKEDLPLQKQQKELNWLDVSKSVSLYLWADYFCRKNFWHTDDLQEYFIYVELSQLAIDNIRKATNLILVKYEDILKNDQIDEQTKQLSQLINYDQVLEILNNFEKEQPNRKNTFIQFINRPNAGVYETVETGNINLQPVFHIEGIYLGVFPRRLEKWYVFNSGQGQLPPDDLVNQAKAIIIPGSAYSVYDNEKEWIVNFRKWIAETHPKFPHLKWLGICFGEQILAHSLGGHCEYTELKKQNKNYFNKGIDQCSLEEKFYDLKFVKAAGLNQENFKKLGIIKLHGDCVTKVPPNCYVISTSPICIEGYVSNDEKMFCIQGHPEFTKEFTIRKGCEMREMFSAKSENPQSAISLYESGELHETMKQDVHKNEVRNIINFFLRID